VDEAPGHSRFTQRDVYKMAGKAASPAFPAPVCPPDDQTNPPACRHADTGGDGNGGSKMLNKEVIAQIRHVAAETGAEAAALLAVVEVESGGQVFALIDGRKEPLIRFEGHYFDRLLTPKKRQRARDEGLAAPKAGAVANPRAQNGRWRLLGRAIAIDRAAALQSVSWGVGQVMGANWKRLNYADVEALVAEARAGAAGQVRLMIRFIGHAGLGEALARHDWAAFARGYNGPSYRALGYHEKIAAAYRRHAVKPS
jgi:hypothetical protein